MPAFGVYFTKAIVDGKTYSAITNVGQKPTVTDDEASEVLAETYLYDYEGNLYEKELTVQFCQFYREEKKFDGLDVLKAQLQKDMEAGRKFWA